MNFTLTTAALGAMIVSIVFNFLTIQRIEEKIDRLETQLEECKWE